MDQATRFMLGDLIQRGWYFYQMLHSMKLLEFRELSDDGRGPVTFYMWDSDLMPLVGGLVRHHENQIMGTETDLPSLIPRLLSYCDSGNRGLRRRGDNNPYVKDTSMWDGYKIWLDYISRYFNKKKGECDFTPAYLIVSGVETFGIIENIEDQEKRWVTGRFEKWQTLCGITHRYWLSREAGNPFLMDSIYDNLSRYAQQAYRHQLPYNRKGMNCGI